MNAQGTLIRTRIRTRNRPGLPVECAELCSLVPTARNYDPGNRRSTGWSPSAWYKVYRSESIPRPKRRRPDHAVHLDAGKNHEANGPLGYRNHEVQKRALPGRNRPRVYLQHSPAKSMNARSTEHGPGGHRSPRRTKADKRIVSPVKTPSGEKDGGRSAG